MRWPSDPLAGRRLSRTLTCPDLTAPDRTRVALAMPPPPSLAAPSSCVWRIEAEDEVDEWLLKLAARDAARVRFSLDLLREYGSALAMPYAHTLGAGCVRRPD
ncbi:MAG: hypothetical protein ACRD0K_03740 [Egibacteraceae bacterium]